MREIFWTEGSYTRTGRSLEKNCVAKKAGYRRGRKLFFFVTIGGYT